MIWAEAAHWLGLVPLAWIAMLRLRGRRLNVAYWWLAVAFGISFFADTAAHWIDPWVVSVVYPVSQTAIVAAVLLTQTEATTFALVLAFWAVIVIVLRGYHGPDVILRSLAWLSIVAIVWNRWTNPMRGPLLVYFGLGLVAWWIHSRWLVVGTWFPYQGCRAVGIGWFCLKANEV